MPESKGRPEGELKVKERRKHQTEKKVSLANRLAADRDWVKWVFIPLILLGVAWLIVYYIAWPSIPFMSAIGGIGIGLIAAGFVVLTFWK